MTRRDWWIGIVLVAGALIAHVAIPRYEWHQVPGGIAIIRVDRWFGSANYVRPSSLADGQR